MKKLLIGTFAFAALAMASCSKSDNNNSNPTTTARVMFVNGSAGTQPVDANVNSVKVNSATNLAYLKGSGYLNVKSGTDTVSFKYTNSQTLFNSTTTTFTAGGNYSVFAGGLTNPPTILVTSDDLSAPSSGKAKIRIVNLSADTAHISMLIGINTIFSNVGSNQATSFSEVSAGSSTIQLGNAASTISPASQTLVAGKIYTVIYTGTFNGATSVALTATMIANN